MKKICSFILMCAMVFCGIGFTQSQINTAYAMPVEELPPGNIWYVTGQKDLMNDKLLVYKRNCPQGRDHAKSVIRKCIRENKTLIVHYRYDIFRGGDTWWYYVG
jgi:hypothetical protein